MYFHVTDDYKQWLIENKKEGSAYKIIDGVVMGRLASACWFTNIDHGKRHEPLLLDTMAHNLKYNKKLRKKLEKEYGKIEYPRYDNYDAIEVPFVECTPMSMIVSASTSVTAGSGTAFFTLPTGFSALLFKSFETKRSCSWMTL